MPLKKGGFQNPVRFAPTSVASVTGNRLQDGQGGALFLWLSLFAGVTPAFFLQILVFIVFMVEEIERLSL